MVRSHLTSAPTYLLIAVLIIVDVAITMTVLEFVPHDQAVVLVGMIGSILTPAIATLLIKEVVVSMEERQAALDAKAASYITTADLRSDKALSTLSKEIMSIREQSSYAKGRHA